MTFLRSVAAFASVLLSTLHALPATAESAPSPATPAPRARLVLPPYPVSFAAARKYEPYVGPTLHTDAGERGLDLVAPSRILVTPPEGGTGKAVGLTLGIAGPILTLV